MYDTLVEQWLGYGAVEFNNNGWKYLYIEGEACLRLVTLDTNSAGPVPNGMEFTWFDPANYDAEVEPDDPDADDEEQMSVTGTGISSWMWWGPRNRYYNRWRDATGQSPTMICGESDPADAPMLCTDEADSDIQMVLLPGDAP